jgi:hypothetical protein
MEVPVTAIEMTGTVDENRQLKLDGELPFAGPKRVRVFIQFKTENRFMKHKVVLVPIPFDDLSSTKLRPAPRRL